MEPIGIGGAWTFTPTFHGDDRGYFLEWFRAGELSGAVGHRPEIAQANCSVSRRGAVRGIHFASVPPGQAKYVTCVSGAILDVVVDIRVGSPSYGRWEGVRLDDTSRRALYLSEGLGHAFTALSEQATVIYLCSTPYAPGREYGVHPLDPDIGIEWPADTEPVLSPKDAAAPTLEQARLAGLLPVYADCEAYLARLRQAADAPDPAAGRLPARGRHRPGGGIGPGAASARGGIGPVTVRAASDRYRPVAVASWAASSSGRALRRAVRQSPIGGTPSRAQAS